MTIEEYWRWWEDARDDVQAAIEQEGADRDVLHELLRQVSAVGLVCEMSAGQRSRHAICASANGDPAMRKLAYRWRDAGPPADEVFEYHAVADRRRPGRDAAHDDDEFAFAEFRFGVTVDEPRRSSTSTSSTPLSEALDEQPARAGRVHRARQHPRRGGGRALDRRAELERRGAGRDRHAGRPARARSSGCASPRPPASGRCCAPTTRSRSPRARCARSTIRTSTCCASSRRAPSTTTSRRCRTTRRRW